MNKETFPAYLAFGKFNQQSIRQEVDHRKAEYELLGNRVMGVTIRFKPLKSKENGK